jgi:putative glutamine amidotransferase
MQFMGLEAGGDLNQHLPDDDKRGELHADGAKHAISGPLGDGTVHSRHHQAMRTSGTLDIVARAPDGVIEAVQDSQRDFYLGVQWHPERSGPGPLGLGVFRSLVAAAAGRMDFREHVSHAAS